MQPPIRILPRVLLAAAAALGLLACNALRLTPTPAPTRTPPAVLADAFFSGYAYVDSNGNGQVDAGDAPLEGATFIVRLGYGEVGALTDSTGTAFVTVPGGADYPVTLMMKPPKDSSYVLIGPESIVRTSAGGDKAEFLFRAR